MSKKGTKALASATLMSLVLTTALSAGPVKAAQGSVTRIGAADRYATAAQVATQNWKDGAKDVVLVSGEGYADAVSASALAKQLNAPILLTTAGSLNSDAKAALETLKPTNVYVVGGNASVSASVRSDLKAANYTLVELQGANRYETNVAVAKKLVELGVKADNVLLVGGEGFSDALSVAPVAAAKGQILLLGNNNVDSMKSVIDFVKTNSSKVTVVGTSNVISDAIYSAVGAVDRVNGGADRFNTNINVLNKFTDDLKSDKLYVANATGNGYADALVASALAGKSAAPLVLVDTDGTTATDNAIAYIKTKATKTTDLNVVGGTGVVSDSVVSKINEAVNPTTPGTGDATVNSITATNLNQIKVEFNDEVDEDTAEDISNYKLDGTVLTTGSAVAVRQSDNKTVIITLLTPQKQYDNEDVTVKKGILTKDKSGTIPEFTQSVTFSDTTVPTLKSVTAQGNNKVTVEFSEAVNMVKLSTIIGKMQINGQNVSSFGLDTSYSTIKDGITTGSSIYWSSKIELYFDSALPTGNNTFKVSDGESEGVLADAANFVFKETSMDFTVDSISTKPEVKNVTATDDGKVYIDFDRAMDTKTAKDPSYYAINGDSNLASSVISRSSIKFNNNDTQVEIDGISSLLQSGSNTIYIKNSVKDAYGNKIADDTRKSFELVEDSTKPTVTGVTLVDSQTLRVRFSKDVNSSYATNVGNYKLKDKDGTDITSHISGVTKVSADVYDVKIYRTYNSKDSRLTSGDYTLTIKNIVDTTTKQNTMDDQTFTVSGSDTVAPYVSNVVNKSDDTHKAIVIFSEEMNSSTITDKSNYKYVNGSGDTKSLPDGATVTASGDDKSVTIKFPTSYTVCTGESGTDDNHVNKIIIANVKDTAGNTLDTIAASSAIASYGTLKGATVDDTSFKLYYDGDNLKADVKFSRSIDSLNVGDFSINGVKPNSGYVNGDKVTLVWNDADSSNVVSGATVSYNNGKTNSSPYEIDLVKDLGYNAKLVITSPSTTDETGLAIADNTGVQVYDFTAAPKTTSDYWTATAGTTDATIAITFDTELDTNSGTKVDDFVFTAADGTNLEADDVSIKGDTVYFTFHNSDTAANGKTYADYFKAGSSSVKVKAKSTVTIRSHKDQDGNYASYAPSDDDLKVRTVDVK